MNSNFIMPVSFYFADDKLYFDGLEFDTHNYQLLNVSTTKDKFNIPIIVCGTGGAKQDNLDLKDIYSKSYNNYTIKDYNIELKYGIQEYGYCKIILKSWESEMVSYQLTLIL